MAILVFFVAHYYLSLFTQTFYLHRYAAHKMFTMNKFWERFFYAFTYVCQGSSFLSPRAYALLHRMHHAYSDTELDPHSPHFSNNAFDMMWKALEAFGGTVYSRFGWGTLYVLFYIHFATAWWQYLLLPIHFLMGPIHGAIVNWGGHKYGYQNFDNNDKSKNTLALDFLAFGELFQNNHHKLPMRVNFGVKWWEFDPTYVAIWTLDKARIIKIKRKNVQPKQRTKKLAQAA